jgi:hypothetical protein
VKGAGLTVPLVAADAQGRSWFFDTSGGFTTTHNGLARTEAVWRALGRAHVLAAHGKAPLVLLTSHLPRRGSQGDQALRAGAGAVFDVVDVRSEAGLARLAAYGRGGAGAPLPGFWDARLPIPAGGLRVVRGGRP